MNYKSSTAEGTPSEHTIWKRCLTRAKSYLARAYNTFPNNTKEQNLHVANRFVIWDLNRAERKLKQLGGNS